MGKQGEETKSHRAAFCTGVGEQKHVNLQHSPLVAVTTGSNRPGTPEYLRERPPMS